MFTGLIEEVGKLLSRTPSANGGAQLKVAANKVLDSIALGDSIAVNGVCLTAIDWDKTSGWVIFDAVEETLRLTTLKSLNPGASLNLERSLALGDRLGGHFVTGHVDGQGQLHSRKTLGNGVIHKFSCPSQLLQLIATKGSVTIDGISLTVTEVTGKDFSVWIVPHTLKATNLGGLDIGSLVNIENDILAKYVSKALGNTQAASISFERLKKAGFC